MTDYAHNAVANGQRREKALGLARQLYTELTPERRRQIARDAGVRPGSDETWALACDLLSQRLTWDANHPQPKPVDCHTQGDSESRTETP